MSIELTYDDDADQTDQTDIDRALLRALDDRRGYVVQLTTAHGAEDVVIEWATDDTLSFRAYDKDAGGPTGDLRSVDAIDIWGIKIY